MKENKQYIYVKTTMDRVDALSKQLTKHVDGLSNQLSDHIDLNSVRCSGASCVFVCRLFCLLLNGVVFFLTVLQRLLQQQQRLEEK